MGRRLLCLRRVCRGVGGGGEGGGRWNEGLESRSREALVSVAGDGE